jgi:hypothetical protein
MLYERTRGKNKEKIEWRTKQDDSASMQSDLRHFIGCNHARVHSTKIHGKIKNC